MHIIIIGNPADGFQFIGPFPATAHKNVGSIMQPCTMRECTVLR